jgi:hypothetical protein
LENFCLLEKPVYSSIKNTKIGNQKPKTTCRANLGPLLHILSLNDLVFLLGFYDLCYVVDSKTPGLYILQLRPGS